MSQILKVTLSFQSSRFSVWPKGQDQDLKILRTTRAFKVKLKAFSIIFKGLSVAKNCIRSENSIFIRRRSKVNEKDISRKCVLNFAQS